MDTKPDTESKYESDTSGSTKAVNSKTKLKDGVYKPDKFSWSGGSGRVNITCDKVTIKNGQALATIVFSSSAYQYVKANGKKYLPTHTGGKSIFVIPVELNKNNSIIGMTTKMSTAHEITYSILVYLSAADEAGDGISEVMKNWMKKHRISSVWNTNQKQNWTMRNISKSITMIRM